MVFGAGILLGARDGALVGAVTMLLYTLFNPYGPAHPVLMAAQVVGMALAGVAGAWFAGLRFPERPPAVRAAVLAINAVGVTLLYDLLTNLADGAVYGQTMVKLIAGIPFSLWHIGTNVALFVTLGTAFAAVLSRYAARLSS